jgi:hypothetical protein
MTKNRIRISAIAGFFLLLAILTVAVTLRANGGQFVVNGNSTSVTQGSVGGPNGQLGLDITDVEYFSSSSTSGQSTYFSYPGPAYGSSGPTQSPLSSGEFDVIAICKAGATNGAATAGDTIVKQLSGFYTVDSSGNMAVSSPAAVNVGTPAASMAAQLASWAAVPRGANLLSFQYFGSTTSPAITLLCQFRTHIFLN